MEKHATTCELKHNSFNKMGINIPQMGKSPKVMPRAAEKANCFGSVPLLKRYKISVNIKKMNGQLKRMKWNTTGVGSGLEDRRFLYGTKTQSRVRTWLFKLEEVKIQSCNLMDLRRRCSSKYEGVNCWNEKMVGEQITEVSWIPPHLLATRQSSNWTFFE